MEPGEIGKESGMALSFRWGDTAQPPLSQDQKLATSCLGLPWLVAPTIEETFLFTLNTNKK